MRHAFSGKLILELLLHWIQLSVEGVVHSRVQTRHHLLVYPLVLALRIVRLSSSHEDLVLLQGLRLLLLDHGVNERWLVVEIDAMLRLQIVDVVVQEGLVAAQLLPDRREADIVERGLHTHGLQREE